MSPGLQTWPWLEMILILGSPSRCQDSLPWYQKASFYGTSVVTLMIRSVFLTIDLIHILYAHLVVFLTGLYAVINNTAATCHLPSLLAFVCSKSIIISVLSNLIGSDRNLLRLNLTNILKWIICHNVCNHNVTCYPCYRINIIWTFSSHWNQALHLWYIIHTLVSVWAPNTPK
jgi:hypothetical protein